MDLRDIANALKQQKKLSIITHVNPDGDALGSSFGLKEILKKLGIEADVVLEDHIPEKFAFAGWKPMIYAPSMHAECVAGLDASDLQRFGSCERLFTSAPVQFVIDHHLNSGAACRYFYAEPAAAATGELIFDLARLLGVPLDKRIALPLYIAIMTDTGGCKYGNTTRRTHEILAQLIDYVDHAYVNRMVFDVMSMEKLRVKSKLLSTVEFYMDGKISVIGAEKELVSQEFELDGIVNDALNIQGVQAGILLKERAEQEVKVSLRTAGELNAMEICRKFDGGGHKNAAGCTFHTGLAEAKRQFVQETQRAITEHEKNND